MNSTTLKVATAVVISGVTIFVVYRCYKYGSFFGGKRQDEKRKGEDKRSEETSGSTSPGSPVSEAKTMKRKKRHRRRRRARTRAIAVPTALHESSTDSSSVIKN